MPSNPIVIFFDAVGTLIHLPLSVGEHYRRVALAFGISPDAKALDRAFRAVWKAAPVRPACDGPRPDDDKGWWRELVARVFETVLSGEEKQRFDSSAYFEAVYAHFAEHGVWSAYEEAPQVLAKLHETGHRLGVISNFDGRLRKVLADLQLEACFEHLVISSEVGVDKPDPRMFQHALARFGVTAAEAMHVGDDPRTDWGAEAAGLRVFRLERPEQTLHDLLPFLTRSDST